MASNFLHDIVGHFISYAFCVTLITWLSLAIGALLTFIIRKDHDFPRTFTGFLRFMFPREIITTKSCRVDMMFYVVSRCLYPVYGPAMIATAICSAVTYNYLSLWFGSHAQNPEGLVVWLLVLAITTLSIDFINFYTHYLDHKIRTLWEFHKVHHSATFLIPITNRRFHPVQDIFDNAGTSILSGFTLGLCSYVFSMPMYDYAIAGLDAYFLLNLVSFYHLRHSHVNMSYGWLEKWIISPAQHQLHHSQEVEHWDKNFGLCLSIWDRMFGTFLYSQPKDSFRLGLPGNQGDEYVSIFQLYITPFIRVCKAGLRQFSSITRTTKSINSESRIGLDLEAKIAQTDVE